MPSAPPSTYRSMARFIRNRPSIFKNRNKIHPASILDRFQRLQLGAVCLCIHVCPCLHQRRDNVQVVIAPKRHRKHEVRVTKLPVRSLTISGYAFQVRPSVNEYLHQWERSDFH